ncbi:hypothetical protein QQ008_00560 [Fulvivirgaceae bacterium BMA10]|uniref:Secreted protein n=1 Tax=Splendidivirga corallicola TaxID=3051826 RepID=A0ABT8KGI9_9BACT|nr:hypothetical protein [Fulvivirgaceae bacterium BMA10]
MNATIKSIAFLLLFYLSIPGVRAQNQQINHEFGEVRQLVDEVKFKQRSSNLPEDVQGSPYLSKEFIRGEVHLKSKSKYKDVPLRYNIYNDDIEFEKDGQVFALGSKIHIDQVVIGLDTFVYLTYLERETVKQRYFKSLVRGKASLLIKMNTIFKEKKASTGILLEQPAQFDRQQDVLFIKVDNKLAIRIPGKKKLSAIFEDKQELMAAFIKAEKLSTRNQLDLVKLVNYYNSL